MSWAVVIGPGIQFRSITRHVAIMSVFPQTLEEFDINFMYSGRRLSVGLIHMGAFLSKRLR